MLYVNAHINVIMERFTMETPNMYLIEQIERCRRLADEILGIPMAQALRNLARNYEAQVVAKGGNIAAWAKVR